MSTKNQYKTAFAVAIFCVFTFANICIVYKIVTREPGFENWGKHGREFNVTKNEPSASLVRTNKIIKAKDFVRSYVAQYPDTLDFHSWSYEPTVSGDTVTLKFTCKNAFGVPETHVMDIEI